MTKILYWIPTTIFLLVFLLILLLFHPLQVVGLRLGYKYHKHIVDAMIWCIVSALWVLGSPIRYRGRDVRKHLPVDKPLILVSNHQSMFDIPAIGWFLRRHHPKYIAKVSLAKGIPSISFNIRHGGSIYIDRKDRGKALQKIDHFTDYLNQYNRSGTIFPEGTRSKDGSLGPFKSSGLLQMLEKMPEAVVVPIAIEHFWKITRYGMKPIPFGIRLRCTIMAPVERKFNNEMVINEVEKRIQQTLSKG